MKGAHGVRRWRRRFLFTAAGSVLLALLLGLWLWYRWLPGYRPGLHRGERYGVDVSGHQGYIDWNKVARDRIMVELDDLYPGYGFAQHKGYGTVGHRAALALHGPCAVHRESFAPVRACSRHVVI